MHVDVNDFLKSMFVADEYWAAHPELHDIPIYYASQLAKKCMAGKTWNNNM